MRSAGSPWRKRAGPRTHGPVPNREPTARWLAAGWLEHGHAVKQPDFGVQLSDIAVEAPQASPRHQYKAWTKRVQGLDKARRRSPMQRKCWSIRSRARQ